MGVAARTLRLLVFLADVGLVYLNRLALAAHWRQIAGRHGLAQPMRHEPGSLDRNAERPGELVAADALLAAAQEIHRLKPDM